MTLETIIKLFKKADAAKLYYTDPVAAQRVAQMIADAENEACEALYQHEDVLAPVGNSAWGEAYQDGWTDGAQAYRDAIRARKEIK